jgi:hypothetical protein
MEFVETNQTGQNPKSGLKLYLKVEEIQQKDIVCMNKEILLSD